MLAALVPIGLAVGHILGGPRPGDRAALAIVLLYLMVATLSPFPIKGAQAHSRHGVRYRSQTLSKEARPA
jgi:hypothetical protein